MLISHFLRDIGLICGFYKWKFGHFLGKTFYFFTPSLLIICLWLENENFANAKIVNMEWRASAEDARKKGIDYRFALLVFRRRTPADKD